MTLAAALQGNPSTATAMLPPLTAGMAHAKGAIREASLAFYDSADVQTIMGRYISGPLHSLLQTRCASWNGVKC